MLEGQFTQGALLRLGVVQALLICFVLGDGFAYPVRHGEEAVRHLVRGQAPIGKLWAVGGDELRHADPSSNLSLPAPTARLNRSWSGTLQSAGCCEEGMRFTSFAFVPPTPQLSPERRGRPMLGR